MSDLVQLLLWATHSLLVQYNLAIAADTIMHRALFNNYQHNYMTLCFTKKSYQFSDLRSCKHYLQLLDSSKPA